MDNIRVVLADDHPMIRNSLSNLLNHQAGIEVVGVASDGREALDLVQNLAPCILVLDLSMPVIGGVEVTRRMRASLSPVRILVLSIHLQAQLIAELLEGGVSGYISKDEALECLIPAIYSIAAGKTYISPMVSRIVSGSTL